MLSNRKVLIAFIALGLVSLFADMTYEGGRSVLGAFLKVLSAPAIVAGAVSVGDFIGYLMRGVGGLIASKLRSSRGYWGMIFAGYFVNLFAVPALALVGNWWGALALVIIERAGKGLRTPVRDVVLAEVTEGIGKGKGFGLHEVMDQIGAVSGPLVVAYALSQNGFRYAFAVLAVPAAASLAMLAVASYCYPRVKAVETKRVSAGLGRTYWLFIASVATLSLGFMHWSLVAYHVELSGTMPTVMIPMLYTIAMLVDAAVAFPVGHIYDRVGPKSLIITPVLTALIPPLVLLTNSAEYLILASVLWGAVMGIYETNMRVAIADLVEPSQRPKAYGTFGLIYGASWAIGNVIMGALYSVNKLILIAFVVFAEIAAMSSMLRFLKAVGSQ